MRVKVHPIASSVNKSSFLYQLKPLTVLMRCLGIDLDSDDNKLSKGFIFVLGLILFLVNIASQLFVVTRIVLNKQNSINQTEASSTDGVKTKGNSDSSSWDLIIEFASIGLVTIGCQTTLLFHSHYGQQWKVFWNDLKMLVLDSTKSLSFYRVSVIGIGYIFLEWLVFVSLNMMGEMFFYKDRMGNDETESLIIQISNWLMMILWIYGPSCLILFSVIGWVISLGFESLQEHLCLNVIINTNGQCLSEFKRRHARLCDATDRLSRLFGPILLVWLVYIFTNFISLSYFLASGLRAFGDKKHDLYSMLSSTVQVIQLSIQLLIITIVPHRMKQQALKSGIRLRQIVLNDSNLQSKINFLTSQVFLSLPDITALDYCDVNLTLIPTLIGTTLTYLIILCQFQTPSY